MDSKFKSFKDNLSLGECEKTNITTPFSINDILTKEHDSKSEFENGSYESFGGKFNLLGKAGERYGKDGVFSKKDVLDKGLKYYDGCHSYRDYNEDGVLDMSRKNSYPITELSGKFHISIFTCIISYFIYVYCLYM